MILTSSLPAIGRPRQQPATDAGAPAEPVDRVMQIAESLGLLPQVLLDKYGQKNFAPPPPDSPENEIAHTVDEDEDGRLPLALDTSSSSSAEEDAEAHGHAQVGAQEVVGGEDQRSGAEERHQHQDEKDVSPRFTCTQKGKRRARTACVEDEHEEDAPRFTRAQKGKGRATTADLENHEREASVQPPPARAQEAPRPQAGTTGAPRPSATPKGQGPAIEGLSLDDILGGLPKRKGPVDFSAAITTAMNTARAKAAATGGDYFTTVAQWMLPEVEDVDSFSLDDLEDKRLEQLEEAMRRTMGEVDEAPPLDDGPAHGFDFDLHQVKGCTGVEMRRIAEVTGRRAERIRVLARKRLDFERQLHFLRCQAAHMEILNKVVASKRIWLEKQLARFTKAEKRSRKTGGSGSGGDGGDDGGNNGGAGGSGGRPAGDNGDDERRDGGDRPAEDHPGDKNREREDVDEGEDELKGGSDKENEVVKENAVTQDEDKAPAASKPAEKTVAPPVAAGQRAAQRMVRRLERMSSLPSPVAGPSTAQAVPNTPALLPAWDADERPRAKTGWESSSDSDSSPPPPHIFPQAPIARRQSPPRNIISPLVRSSALMRRNIETRAALARLPRHLIRLATASAAGRMLSSSPSAGSPSPPRGAAQGIGLSAAFSTEAAGANAVFGGMPPPFSPRAGESISHCWPRVRQPLAERGASGSAVREDEYDE